MSLTDREMDILEMAARGWTNCGIAAYYDISRQTVKNHMSSVMAKLCVTSRTGAVVVAFQLGLIDLFHVRVERTYDHED